MENKIIISSNNIADTEYSKWLEEIKQLYKNSQIKASLKVNKELLKFYWQLGKEMVDRKIEEKWGTKIVERLSLDLKKAFPESKGFSTTNLWYIKKWYLFYNQSDIILHQVGGEFGERIFKLSQHCRDNYIDLLKSAHYN